MYLLYSKNDINDVKNSSKFSNSNPIDILELKQQKQYGLTTYEPEKIKNIELNKKLHEVTQMLSKTRTLLKTYNQNSTNVIIKDKDIEQLVNLDIKQKNYKKTKKSRKKPKKVEKNEKK